MKTMNKLFWHKSKEEADKILKEDPKNSIKLWIKNLCLKTDTGTRFYYYMHRISLMYGHITRMLMLMALILAGTIYAGFLIINDQTWLVWLALINVFFKNIGIYAIDIISYAIMIAFAFLLGALILALAYYIVYFIIYCVYKIIVNIIAAIFF